MSRSAREVARDALLGMKELPEQCGRWGLLLKKGLERGEDMRAVRFQRYENYAVLSAELLIDKELFQKATLKMEYWPDALQMPQLLMTAGSDGVNYRVEGRN